MKKFIYFLLCSCALTSAIEVRLISENQATIIECPADQMPRAVYAHILKEHPLCRQIEKCGQNVFKICELMLCELVRFRHNGMQIDRNRLKELFTQNTEAEIIDLEYELVPDEYRLIHGLKPQQKRDCGEHYEGHLENLARFVYFVTCAGDGQFSDLAFCALYAFNSEINPFENAKVIKDSQFQGSKVKYLHIASFDQAIDVSGSISDSARACARSQEQLMQITQEQLDNEIAEIRGSLISFVPDTKVADVMPVLNLITAEWLQKLQDPSVLIGTLKAAFSRMDVGVEPTEDIYPVDRDFLNMLIARQRKRVIENPDPEINPKRPLIE